MILPLGGVKVSIARKSNLSCHLIRNSAKRSQSSSVAFAAGDSQKKKI